MQPTHTSLHKVLHETSQLKHSFKSDEISQFCQQLSIKQVCAGDLIMHKGCPADAMVVVMDGLLQVLVDDRQVALLHSGDFSGEAMFSDDAIRKADVQALEDSVIAEFSLDHFNTFLTANQTLALRYREYFRTLMAARQAQNDAERYVDQRKYLALVAHNNMKESLMEFCQLQRSKISEFPLIATGTTGTLLFKKTGLVLTRKVASGPLGGDQAVGDLISTNNICGVIFFRDPLSAHPHHADIEALGRLCDVYQVPLATNPPSGEAILDYLLSGKAEQKLIPNHVLEAYTKGQNKVVESA